MNRKFAVFMSAVLALFFIAILFQVVYAEKKPPESVTLKLEGAKFPPVTFSHSVHTDKVKAACVVCHHKDPKEPAKCMTCHDRNEVKNGAPPIKDAYHKNCIDCHKESVAKQVAAPTKCNECHKKQ